MTYTTQCNQLKCSPLNRKLLFIGLTFSVSLLSTSPEAFAVKAGEMKSSVDYVTALLDNNIVPLILVAGVVAGTAFAFLKSTFGPLALALVTAVGYGFANKWLTSAYSLCV